jgi:hypothetical protein
MIDAENRIIQGKDDINDYYEVNRTHLKWSFWASIVALSIGLAAVIVGIGLILSGKPELTSTISTIGGILTQFIGAGFFYLYTRNLKQLNIFYEKLIKLQDTEYAIKVANSLPDNDKNKALASITNILITRNEPRIAFSPEHLLALKELNSSQLR